MRKSGKNVGQQVEQIRPPCRTPGVGSGILDPHYEMWEDFTSNYREASDQ
jgi:hypothetical protein